MTQHDDDEDHAPPSKKEKKMALAFHNKQLYRGATPAELSSLTGAKILAEPADLFTSAWPNTIYVYVQQQIGELPLSLKQMSNNPGYWFEALGKMAKKVEVQQRQNCVKKGFTFNAKEPITEASQEGTMPRTKKAATTEKKRKHLDKSLKIKKVAAENPRRKGTHGYKSWEKIDNGMTVAEYLQKGGRTNDLLWEAKKGNVTLS